MKVEYILLQTVGHFFDLDKLVSVMFIKDALDTYSLCAGPTEILNELLRVSATIDCANIV